MQSRHIRFDLNFYCCFWWMRKQFLETGQWGDYSITNKHALPISLWSNMLLLEWSKSLSSTESDICPQEIREKVSWRLKRRIVVVVQSINCVWLFATQWTAAYQASLSFTISQSLLKFMCIKSVMPSKYLILCSPPSPVALNFSQHHGLFQWVGSSHQGTKISEKEMASHFSILVLRTPWMNILEKTKQKTNSVLVALNLRCLWAIQVEM